MFLELLVEYEGRQTGFGMTQYRCDEVEWSGVVECACERGRIC